MFVALSNLDQITTVLGASNTDAKLSRIEANVTAAISDLQKLDDEFTVAIAEANAIETQRLAKVEAERIRFQNDELRRKEEEERQRILQQNIKSALDREAKKRVLSDSVAAARRYRKQESLKSIDVTAADAKKVADMERMRLFVERILAKDVDLAEKLLVAANSDADLRVAEDAVKRSLEAVKQAEEQLKAILRDILQLPTEDSVDDVEEDFVVTTFGVSTGKTYDEFIKGLTFVGDKFKDNVFDAGNDLKRVIEADPRIVNSIDDHCLPPNPKPDDVKQGALGDCYFLSALATIAERPELLQKLFPVHEVDRSLFAVKLFHNGAFRTIVLDDYFPATQRNFKYAHGEGFENSGRSLWVMLLEKAYAKLHGSYKAIEGGFESEAMADLTGGVPEITTPLDQNMDELWMKMKSLCDARHLIGAVSFCYTLRYSIFTLSLNSYILSRVLSRERILTQQVKE